MTGTKLVIGVGNRDRGDDGLGPMVIDALADRRPPEATGHETVLAVIEGDLSSLPLRWTPDHDVVIVDAMVTGRPIGSVVVIDALARSLEPTTGLLSSHGIGLADAIELARLLRRLPTSLTVVAVEVGSPASAALDPFAAPGPETEAVVTVVSDVLAAWAWSPDDDSVLRASFRARCGATRLS